MSNKKNEESFKQHVDTSIIIFSLITTIFFLIKAFVFYSSVKSPDTKINPLKTLSSFAFAVLFFMFSYITNISATQEQIICGKRNYRIAFYATLIPFAFIYSLGIFIITIFPGWNRCFSNTIGSYLIDLCGLKSVIAEKLKPTRGSYDTSEIYKLYKKSPQVLLNEIQLDPDENIERSSKMQLQEIGIEFDDENQKLLKQYIYLKETIGEGIWHYLFGIITILVSYNTILAEHCNAFSVEKDEFRRYLNDKFEKN
jgi:hypothetical protein